MAHQLACRFQLQKLYSEIPLFCSVLNYVNDHHIVIHGCQTLMRKILYQYIFSENRIIVFKIIICKTGLRLCQLYIFILQSHPCLIICLSIYLTYTVKYTTCSDNLRNISTITSISFNNLRNLAFNLPNAI